MNAIEPIYWSFLLLLAGSALVILEVFFPSAGLLSLLSASAFLGAIINAFYFHGVTVGFVFTAATVFLVPTMLGLGFKFLPHTPMGRVLLGELPTEEEVDPNDSRRELLGDFGFARSLMLPSGSVEINGQRFDAVTQGQAIDPGTRVVVVEVSANRVVVRPATEDESEAQAEAELVDIANSPDILERSIEELGIEPFDDPLA